MSLIEQVPSSAGAARATWATIGWGYTWRLGLAGLVSFIITGLLLHTRISMYFTPILFISAPLFSHPLIALDITFSPGDWLIPSSFVTLFSSVPFLARFPIFSLIFLPFVLPFPGVLSEHTLWKNRTIFPGLGIVLVFLGMAIGAKDLLLTLLEYLNSFWPFGTGSALFYCAALLCETTALALLAALALGNAQKPISRWNQRLLWLMLGAASFAGSLLPLAAALQKFIYYADGRAPFRFLSLDTATITIVLAADLLLSFPAAFWGGWLRTRLIR